jgi:iron(III) transport system ATP-binding protein
VSAAPVLKPPAPAAHLSLRGLSKRFGSQTVLQDVCLDLAQDEFVCLLGPSGCGKTTLLRILCGIETPDAGQVLLKGQDITRWTPAQRRFGVVFQSYALFPNLTAQQNVAYGLHGLGREAIRQRAAEMLELVGLAAHAQKYPAQLSGGQQQRVALARALAPKPGLLLLDEPLSALDAQVRASLRTEIRRVQQQLRLPTVMVTHDQDEALGMADRVLLMQQGSVVQDASPWALYHAPGTDFAARFVGRMNLWPAALHAAAPADAAPAVHAQVGDVRLGLDAAHAARHSASHPASHALLGLRPEAVQAFALHSPPSHTNLVQAELRASHFGGAWLSLSWWVPAMGQVVEHCVVSAQHAPGALLPQQPWRIGEQAWLHLPSAALRLLPSSASTA